MGKLTHQHSGVHQLIKRLERAIAAHGYELKYVQYCEDSETPGLLGQMLGCVNHEKKRVKVAVHRRTSAEIAETLAHELRHIEEPDWDCGGRDVLGRGGPRGSVYPTP